MVSQANGTRPVVDLVFMGYAGLDQVGTGVRQRLYSRAFIVADKENLKDRIVYLVLDLQSGDTAVRDGILAGLKALGPEYSVYNKNNIAVTGTHSHSGPGGWTNYFLHHVSTLGFDKQTWEAVVNGSILSIKRAHESLREGRLSYGKTRVEDANINRSIYSYMANPASERAAYDDTVDKDLSLLRFQDISGLDFGILTFFATHGTSMYNNNTLVTGDNKGVASYIFEKELSKVTPGFVAGFSQSNVGDVSPNVLGPYCEGGVSDGEPCKVEDSTCDGRVGPCRARGPYYGLNDGGTKSCYEIGKRQAYAAWELLEEMRNGISGSPISGPVKSFHTFHDMAFYKFPLTNETIVETCPASLGYSFAAGTTDGPGIADFRQGLNTPRPNISVIWPILSGVVRTPSLQQYRCQKPKPILLDIGEMNFPYAWGPTNLDIQALRIGPMIIIIAPGEATTMAGRRWRNAIAKLATDSGLIVDNPATSTSEPIVLLGGPANTYGHYITTPEEYSIQRYEGASTLFGPHTLDAYIHLTASYLKYLAPSNTDGILTGPLPPNNVANAWSLIPAPAIDWTVWGRAFGSMVTPPANEYRRGDTARVVFVGACPRNNFRLEGTFGMVQKYREPETNGNVNAGMDNIAIDPGQLTMPPMPFMVAQHGKRKRDDRKIQKVDSLQHPIQLASFSTSDLLNNSTWVDMNAISGQSLSTSADPLTDPLWSTHLTDYDWSLVLHWKRTSLLSSTLLGGPSETTLEWEIGDETESGHYRFVYWGDAKSADGKVREFVGVSSSFYVGGIV